MKPIILPELIDKGDSIEGILWRQLFIWGEPRKSGIGTWDGQSHAGWIYPLSLRLPVYPEVFLNSLPGKKKGQPCCRTVEILRETAASYAHGTVGYCTPYSLHMMRSSFVSIKKKKATHVKGPLLTHFFCLPGHIRGTSCHRRDICCLPSSSPLQSLWLKSLRPDLCRFSCYWRKRYWRTEDFSEIIQRSHFIYSWCWFGRLTL